VVSIEFGDEFGECADGQGRDAVGKMHGRGCRIAGLEDVLPATGWGLLTLEKSRPEVNERWTDTASAHEERGLKHRPVTETRRVPIPRELVAILRQHIDAFGVAPDGRIFSSDRGHIIASTAISDVWAEARALALTPAQFASPLAGCPYTMAGLMPCMRQMGTLEPSRAQGRQWLLAKILRCGSWFLGGCGGWPEPGQACSGFVVEHDGFRLVIDLGYAAVPRLLEQAAAREIDAVFISHGHPDHCADLNPLLRGRALATDPPPPLPVYALPGALDAVLALDRPGCWPAP
jgi:hypothetical protein